MPEDSAEGKAFNDVELAIGQLDSLLILPCAAALILSQLMQSNPLSSALAEIVEAEPGLTVRVFSLLRHHGIRLGPGKLSVGRVLEKLPVSVLREALFSVGVLGLSDHRSESNRSGIVLHSLAVACCAKEIAANSSAQVDPQLAYLAGLLHDIGKLAMEQVMPRGFDRIAEQAESQSCSSCVIEQKHLGLDHTILGKRLGQKWHLPEPVVLAIWLHHSDTAAICENVPGVEIAQVVQLADSVVRRCGIGRSGSYDSADTARRLDQSLGLSSGQLEQIAQKLPEAVDAKSRILGLDAPNAVASYCRTLQSGAAQFAGENGKLVRENRCLQSASSHLGFVRDFLLSIDSAHTVTDIAESFAVRWQNFYQTGMVCVYLSPRAGLHGLEAVVVEALAKSKTVCLDAPSGLPAVPDGPGSEFYIIDARENMDWLFGQLEADFDLSQTKVMPLQTRGKAVGAIAFEMRYPSDLEQFSENFEMVTSIAATVLDMAVRSSSQERFAEQFSQMLTGVGARQDRAAVETNAEQTQPEAVSEAPMAALAELAGGAGHELGNPLSVISGRTQQLVRDETDPEKKRMLEQVRDNAGQMTGIINDLMTYAEPPAPRSSPTSVKQIIDEAIQFSSQKAHAEHINVQVELGESVSEVFVDSGQIVSAVANVICNSLESYGAELGPIKITADGQTSGLVRLRISDLGCGMDAETVSKATHPFFSAKPAGRKRGMGLAHAQRLIELNNGSLSIESEPAKGTTVTILLPSE
jgi:putative nucleotidyltransferase with HDIG domain